MFTYIGVGLSALLGWTTRGKKIIEPINVQLGDVLRWNYTGEEGVVVGFDYEEGVRKFIVRQNDGTEIR